MRRFRLIEFHEQPWFPAFLRDHVTDALQHGMHLLRAYEPIAPTLRHLIDTTGHQSVVDLCSGGGGPWLTLSELLGREGGDLQIRLTDKYPNLRAFEAMQAATKNSITFCAEPVDARTVPREMPGFRTMFSSFHHFSPGEAAAVLQDAVDARQCIGIFEITRRAPSAICRMFPWAMLAFVYTPLIRPFRWSRLFWTYVVPVVPLVLLLDGIVSCLRSYQPREMKQIADGLRHSQGYDWQAGEARGEEGAMPITYLTGCPRELL
jgi:hypothetical protein